MPTTMNEVLKFNSMTRAETSLKIQQATHSVSRQMQWRLFIATLFLSDLLLMGAGFRLAYLVRFEINLPVFQQEEIVRSFTYYQAIATTLIPLWLLIFALRGMYNRQHLLGGTEEYSRLFNATAIGMFVVITFGFLIPDFILARGWLLLSWWFAFLFTGLGRFSLRRVVYFLRRHGYFLSPVVIVGANDEGLLLAGQLMQWETSGFHVVGFVDKKLPPGTQLLHGLRCLGKVEQLDEIIDTYAVEEVILASSAFSSRDNMLELFKQYGVHDKVNIRFSSGLYEIITTGLTVKEFAYVPLVGVNPVRLTGVDSLMKLLLDYGLVIPGLILASPILLTIALLVKLDSPGPVIHKRRVIGVGGKEFNAYKFRTMYVNGDEILAAHPELQAELASNHKLKNDPRITRVGHFLRKFSLDELPQLFNVLKLEMSLVGPRMIAPEEIEKYNQWDINLLTVRPGITGLWQVSGRSDVSYEERVQLDMHYIRNWNIWLDLHLLMQTIPAVLRGRGAY